jgi:hypothetical protein
LWLAGIFVYCVWNSTFQISGIINTISQKFVCLTLFHIRFILKFFYLIYAFFCVEIVYPFLFPKITYRIRIGHLFWLICVSGAFSWLILPCKLVNTTPFYLNIENFIRISLNSFIFLDFSFIFWHFKNVN